MYASQLEYIKIKVVPVYVLKACGGGGRAEFTRSVNKVMSLAAYRTMWQYCGLALHMKVR